MSGCPRRRHGAAGASQSRDRGLCFGRERTPQVLERRRPNEEASSGFAPPYKSVTRRQEGPAQVGIRPHTFPAREAAGGASAPGSVLRPSACLSGARDRPDHAPGRLLWARPLMGHISHLSSCAHQPAPGQVRVLHHLQALGRRAVKLSTWLGARRDWNQGPSQGLGVVSSC